MAYAAVISLKHTINDLLESSPRISFVSATRQILTSAYYETASLQQLLERSNDSSSKRLDALDAQIRDAAHQLEDVLEFYESNQLHSEGDLSPPDLDLKEITSFSERAKNLKAEYIEELLTPVLEDEEDGDDEDISVSSNADFSAEMVGYDSYFTEMRDYLLERMRPNDMCFFSYVGVVGTGRSVIAKAVFEDERRRFDCSAWVTIAAKFQQFKEIAVSILDQVAEARRGKSLLLEEDEKILNYLYKALENRRYMIVLDDVRDVQVLEYLKRSFPEQSNGSFVLIITSSEEIAESAPSLHCFTARVGYLEESTWHFMKKAVFGIDVYIPRQLDEAGKRIDRNCGGRRMALAKTLLFLIKAEKSLELWSKLAEDKENPIFVVEDEISEILKIRTELQCHNWKMDGERENFTVGLILNWIDFSASVDKIKMKMYPRRFFPKMQTISLWGMAGIGKSTLANRIVQDESISCHFDHCVWLNLGIKYQPEQIMMDILAKINPSIDKMHLKEVERLVKELSSKRCLIVLDDVWSKEPLHQLKRLFPDIKGRALITTRLAKVAYLGEDDIGSEMRLLDKDESWSLLCKKVFFEGSYPPELEKPGRRIAEKCDGLPLLLIEVANQLLKREKDIEYWNNVASEKESSVFINANNVASEKESSVFINAHEKISKTLLPSYKSLPQYLKPCILYMGVFRNGYEVSTSRLNNLLISEGFLEHFVAECLNKLARRSLVMVKRDTSLDIKKCRLHAVFWYLCNSEAVKINFFHAMNIYDDCSMEKMNGQRRLCIRNSILLGMKEVQNVMELIASAHSLLCVSPFHQYPVPISFDLSLLRVMDALAIRLYEFPAKVVKLAQLKYLALTFHGKLPTSISKLWKLQHLIVSRYMNIKSSEDYSLLPMEIWDMKELEHLQIMGGCLPNPKGGDGLPKLSTLLDLSAQSCTKRVLEMIPNVKRLGVRIELGPNDQANPFCCLNHIPLLSQLESLKCVVLNPHMRYGIIPPSPPSFPLSLKSLSLSGFGYRWEEMRIIGKLRNLEVLKLKRYAFRGPKWTINCLTDFEKLKFLLIEDTDLEQWEIKLPVFQQLECLTFKHCYKLQKLPTYLPISSFRKMKIVDCSPSTVTWAEKLRKDLRPFPIEVHLSWIGKGRP